MKIIALVPVRNEAWVLEHSLACWSGFCDVVIVNDQMSTDTTREICRRFPNVDLLETTSTGPADTVARLPQQARWRLLDAARNYDGHNLLWCTDADELTPPTLARRFSSSTPATLPAASGRVPLLQPLGQLSSTVRISVLRSALKPMDSSTTVASTTRERSPTAARTAHAC
jgi:hypothetical protein